ncbi:MAG: phytanoyl-CoA dioxygenase family protein [Pseudomonadota bacterium]
MLDRPAPGVRYPVWIGEADQSVAALESHLDRRTDARDVPNAAEVAHEIPIYDGARIETLPRREIEGELARVLRDGPGVFAVRGAIRDRALLDAVTDVFLRLIADEAEAGGGEGDHFAAAGRNARLWNAQEKLCLAAPDLYARYMSCQTIRLAAEAWLGPCYQVTAQVNLVRPGGAAQTGHRDYHLGFQGKDRLGAYPAHVHTMSAMLTLQGALAHSDMPVESGPTKLLPFSQTFAPGYVAIHREDVRELFEARYVQLPLAAGDAVFFSPALFHAAGENRTTDHDRFANLLQIGSAYGRMMEALDRAAMCRAVYPVLRDGAFSPEACDAVIAATAEGYPFPTDLDRDPPVGGLAPQSQAELMRSALDENLSPAAFSERLAAHSVRRRQS